ncbi:hypothetical protein SAMD00019534_092520 [Acytostelium subglobosum LB1]|uniref:hypothetical protein n=1 Tax=Acytostelium subglobosum LB1 TaxID=1410327 RepID=UPI000644AE4A|nr:hypothetical protein SAMD00019534_092520 [Acytostelium subglobosum LB1]GAM26077.1 hypothetical protein SAMD00019534_092520 [Acytostelium subglobosum LB1]|eukprot:XP_012751120.1 hypothetical protein SAMD00019534_092520 [Acytostelium subglobosum LB1]
MSSSNFFNKVVFYIVGIPLIEQNKIKKAVKEHGGTIALQVNSQVHYLITSHEEVDKQPPSYKLGTARKLAAAGSLRIVSTNFITDCVQAGRLITDAKYLLLLPSSPKSPTDSSNSRFNFSSPAGDKGNSGATRTCYNILEPILAQRESPQHGVRLFISSTFLDMQEEREQLVHHLMPELAAFCRQRGVDFSFVDLRWGLSREESQRPNAIATCLSEVANCTHFLSLLGNRYGWNSGDVYDQAIKVAAQTRPWLEQYNGRSVTELEILQATKYSPNQMAKQHFFYIKNDKAASMSEADKLTSTADAQEKQTKLHKLITDHELLNSTYKETDIGSLVKSIYKDITQSIEREYPRPVKYDFDIDINLAYAKQLTKVYLNCNQDLVSKMDSYFDTDNGPEDNHPLLITAPHGGGASALISHWLSELSTRAPLDNVMACLAFVGLTPKSRQPEELLKTLYSMIKKHYNVAAVIPDDPQLLIEDLCFWLNVASKDGKQIVWIIDGLDKLDWKKNNDNVYTTISSLLPKRLGHGVKIILTVGDSMATEVTRCLQRMYPGGLRAQALQTLAGSDLRMNFSKVYLGAVGKTLEQSQLTKIAFNSHCQSPLILSSILNELITSGTFDTLDDKLSAMLQCPTPVDLFKVIVLRWLSDKSYPEGLVANVLQLLLHSEYGLYEEELLAILNIKTAHGFLSAARAVLTMDGSSNYLNIYASSLREAIKSVFIDDASSTVAQANSKRLLQSLVDYFVSAAACSDNATSTTLKRRVAIVPRYLTAVDDMKQLKQFLLNMEHFRLLVIEYGKAGLLKLLLLVEPDKKKIVAQYRDAHTAYVNRSPPLEELSAATRDLGIFFEYLSYYDDAMIVMDMSKDLHIRLYSDLHRCIGEDYEAMSCISNKQSKFDDALYLAEKALSIAESVYGPDQYGTCESLKLVGVVLKKQAKYDEAQETYEKATAIIHRFFGYSDAQNVSQYSPQHFNSKLADLYNNLGDIYRKKAVFDKAGTYYQKTLVILENTRNDKDLSFAELFKNLGLVEKKLGHYARATQHYLKALDIVKVTLGDDHASYGLYLCDLADNKRKEDKYKEAEQLYDQALSILKAKLGKKLGHYKEAIEYYQKALNIADKALGPTHPKAGFFTHNIGDCYRKLGDYKQSEVLFAKSLSISQNHFGFDHPEVAEILNSIGLVYKKQAKYIQAEKEYKRAISIVSKAFGSDHPKYGMYTNNLADVYRKMGKYPMAKTCYARALGVIETSLGDQHSEYAEVLYGMGLLNLSMEDYNKSIELINTAIDITTKELGDKHPKIGIYLNSLCEAKLAQKKANQTTGQFSIEQMRQQYERAHDILVEDLGEMHPEMADIWVNRAELEFQHGSHQLAKQYYECALQIIGEVYGKEHVKYESLHTRIKYFIGDVIVNKPEEVDRLSKHSEQSINLVIDQTGKSREESIKALDQCGGDIVNAILQLCA